MVSENTLINENNTEKNKEKHIKDVFKKVKRRLRDKVVCVVMDHTGKIHKVNVRARRHKKIIPAFTFDWADGLKDDFPEDVSSVDLQHKISEWR